VTVEGATAVVVGAGYPAKRRIYERMAQLGARVVIVEEEGHWSSRLVDDGVASDWVAARIVGDPDEDARSVVDALSAAGVEPDAVLTYWEEFPPVAARVAAALGLPGNPVSAVDAARSKLLTREASARAGLPTPRSLRVQSLDELYAAAAEIGFPAVVKPEFGHSQVGCMRVDSFDSLPDIYWLVRKEVEGTNVVNFRAHNDLLLEDYLDGVEFDVDLILQDGECVFSSVSQQSPTPEPSFQETGLHCPPDHGAKPVRRLVELSVQTVQAFGFVCGVLHVEGKCTSKGPRIVEVNARMGGGRIHQLVEAVWNVDLIEAHLRGHLGLPQQLTPSRKPRCAVDHRLVYAPATGRLAALPLGDVKEADFGPFLDVSAEVGQEVDGPDRVFSTLLAEVYVGGKDLKRARALTAELLRDPPVVAPPDSGADRTQQRDAHGDRRDPDDLRGS
jgi:carnosine synthase